jgi:hypothetical protein
MRYTNGDIHIFVPKTAGTDYDYEYENAPSCHNFFAKAYQKRIVNPNRVTVKSNPEDDPQYEGTYEDSSYDILPKEIFKRATLDSDNQAYNMAKAMIKKARIEAKGGYGQVPLNLGSEIFDYIEITDSRQGDTVTGNIGYIHRKVNLQKREWVMSFGFGGWYSTKNLLNSLSLESGNFYDTLSANDLFVKNIHADQLDINWIDPEGNIDLSLIGDSLDNLPDGETYARVKSVHLDAGGLKIDETAIYASGYNPSEKMDGDADLDDIGNGTTYVRVRATDISAGHIKLTDQVTAVGKWYQYNGVVIDASNGILLYGQDTAFRTRATEEGDDVIYIGSDGKLNVVGNQGITIRPASTTRGGFIYSIQTDSITILAGTGDTTDYINLMGNVAASVAFKLPVGTDRY